MWVILPTSQHPSEWNISTIKSLQLLKHKVPKTNSVMCNICWYIQISIDQSIARVHFWLDMLDWSLKIPEGVTELKRYIFVHIFRSKTIKQVKKLTKFSKTGEVHPLTFQSFIVIKETNNFYFFEFPEEKKYYLPTNRKSVGISNNKILHVMRIMYTFSSKSICIFN